MKAYIVNFSISTRILSDKEGDALTDELSKKGREQILTEPENYIYGDNMAFEHDDECPFGTFNTDEEV